MLATFADEVERERGRQRIACCEHSQNMLDRQAMSADDRLAAEDLGVCRDSRKKFGFAFHADGLVDMVTLTGCAERPSQTGCAEGGWPHNRPCVHFRC